MKQRRSHTDLTDIELIDAYHNALTALMAANSLVESGLVIETVLMPLQQVYRQIRDEIAHRGVHPMIGIPRWTNTGGEPPPSET